MDCTGTYLVLTLRNYYCTESAMILFNRGLNRVFFVMQNADKTIQKPLYFNDYMVLFQFVLHKNTSALFHLKLRDILQLSVNFFFS